MKLLKYYTSVILFKQSHIKGTIINYMKTLSFKYLVKIIS